MNYAGALVGRLVVLSKKTVRMQPGDLYAGVGHDRRRQFEHDLSNVIVEITKDVRAEFVNEI